MLYRGLADALVVCHVLFVLFVLLGGLLALRWPRVVWVHLPAAVWGAWVEFSSTICPLTPLENHFRRLGGEGGYSGGFIEHYLLPVLYPAGLARSVQIALGFFVLLLNVAVYARVWRRTRWRSVGKPRQPGESGGTF